MNPHGSRQSTATDFTIRDFTIYRLRFAIPDLRFTRGVTDGTSSCGYYLAADAGIRVAVFREEVVVPDRHLGARAGSRSPIHANDHRRRAGVYGSTNWSRLHGLEVSRHR